jgi:flagellar protein FliO/FliZ
MEDFSFLRFILAFAFVLGLIGLFALALKKWGNKLPAVMGQPGKRLKVIETCLVGAKYKLVLIKRDAKELLLLIGPEKTEVIEREVEEDKNDAK